MLSFLLNPSKQSHGTVRVPWLTLALTAVMAGLYLGGPVFLDLLVFDKAAILRGEVWRFFTGHWVHCSFEHLFWDIVALGILGTVIEIHSPKHFIPSFLASCAAVSIWLLLMETKFSTSCGLSGALNGMLVLAAVIKQKKTGNRVFWFVLLGTLVKIVYESFSRRTVFADLSSQTVFASHAMGFAGGIIYLWVLSLKDRPLFRLDAAWEKLRF